MFFEAFLGFADLVEDVPNLNLKVDLILLATGATGILVRLLALVDCFLSGNEVCELVPIRFE